MLVRIVLAAAAFALLASACGGGAASAPAVTENGLPSFTTEECAYLGEVQRQTATFVDAFAEATDLMDDPQFFSDEWIFALAVPLATFQVLADDAREMKPPESLRAIHNQYVGAVAKIADASDLITQGIDNLDAEKISAATDLFVEATSELSGLPLAVETFAVSRSGSC